MKQKFEQLNKIANWLVDNLRQTEQAMRELTDFLKCFILEVCEHEEISHILDIDGKVSYHEYDMELGELYYHKITLIEVDAKGNISVNTDDYDGAKFVVSVEQLPLKTQMDLAKYFILESGKLNKK